MKTVLINPTSKRQAYAFADLNDAGDAFLVAGPDFTLSGTRRYWTQKISAAAAWQQKEKEMRISVNYLPELEMIKVTRTDKNLRLLKSQL